MKMNDAVGAIEANALTDSLFSLQKSARRKKSDDITSDTVQIKESLDEPRAANTAMAETRKRAALNADALLKCVSEGVAKVTIGSCFVVKIADRHQADEATQRIFIKIGIGETEKYPSMAS